MELYEDIYGDVDEISFEAKVKELEDKNNKLTTNISDLNKTVETLTRQVKILTKTQDILKKNISSLYATAKNEIERKDKIIGDLRRQLDDVLFKRNNPTEYSTKRKFEPDSKDVSPKRKREDANFYSVKTAENNSYPKASCSNRNDNKYGYSTRDPKSFDRRNFDNRQDRRPRSNSRERMRKYSDSRGGSNGNRSKSKSQERDTRHEKYSRRKTPTNYKHRNDSNRDKNEPESKKQAITNKSEDKRNVIKNENLEDSSTNLEDLMVQKNQILKQLQEEPVKVDDNSKSHVKSIEPEIETKIEISKVEEKKDDKKDVERLEVPKTIFTKRLVQAMEMKEKCNEESKQVKAVPENVPQPIDTMQNSVSQETIVPVLAQNQENVPNVANQTKTPPKTDSIILTARRRRRAVVTIKDT